MVAHIFTNKAEWSIDLTVFEYIEMFPVSENQQAFVNKSLPYLFSY